MAPKKSSDNIELLQLKPIPITSFGLTVLCGGVGSGKTFQTLRMREAFLDYADKDKPYDLDDFYNLQGPFTHTIFVTPNTPQSDQTLRDQKQQNGRGIIWIQATEKALDQLCDQLLKMKSQVKEFAGETQAKVRDLMKTESFRESLYKNPGVGPQFWSLFIEPIEKLKHFADYQALLVKEPDPRVRQGMKLLYKQCGLEWDGMMLRPAKIFLIMDDCTQHRCFRNSNSPMREMLDCRRHYGLYAVILTVHGLTDIWKFFRKNVSEYCIFAGSTDDEMAQIYQEGGQLKSAQFTFQDFLNTYHEITGYNKRLAERDEADRRSFMTIFKTPPMVFKNFDKQLE